MQPTSVSETENGDRHGARQETILRESSRLERDRSDIWKGAKRLYIESERLDERDLVDHTVEDDVPEPENVRRGRHSTAFAHLLFLIFLAVLAGYIGKTLHGTVVALLFAAGALALSVAFKFGIAWFTAKLDFDTAIDRLQAIGMWAAVLTLLAIVPILMPVRGDTGWLWVALVPVAMPVALFGFETLAGAAGVAYDRWAELHRARKKKAKIQRRIDQLQREAIAAGLLSPPHNTQKVYDPNSNGSAQPGSPDRLGSSHTSEQPLGKE